MTDKLESDEFIFLVSGCEIHQRQMIKDFIRQHFTPKTVEENETDLSEYILMKISDEYPYMIFESKAKDGTIVAEPIKEMLCFRGSKSECEAEKQRLESEKECSHEVVRKKDGSIAIYLNNRLSDEECVFKGTYKECQDEKKRLESPPLTKGREEKLRFHCQSYKNNDFGCDKQCAECAVEQGKKYDVTLEGLNQNLFNKLHELGVIATQDEMSDIICAIEKDKFVLRQTNKF